MSLENLALADRIYDLLSSSGYQNIGDLMFQLALDEDAVLGISGIGPKAMDEIKEKLSTLTFPSPQPEEVLLEVVELVPLVSEKVVETAALVTEDSISVEQPEELEKVPSAQLTPSEEIAVVTEEISAEPVAVGEEEVPTGEVKVEETEKPVDFNEIFALRPEILTVQDGDEEEDEEDLDKKGKKKKKKKKFVEVVYDPDRDITLVKRKRKRGGDWEDDWNF